MGRAPNLWASRIGPLLEPSQVREVEPGTELGGQREEGRL